MSASALTSKAVSLTSAASMLETMPIKTKTPVKHMASDRFKKIFTDSEEEANREVLP